MPRRRKTIPIIIFSFCFLLVTFAVYQMYEMVVSSGHIESSDYSSSARKQDKKEIRRTGQVTLQWDPVPNAKLYNIYWSTNPGVNKSNGNRIEKATNPVAIKDLKDGTTYYFVITAVNESGESAPSKEISYTVNP